MLSDLIFWWFATYAILLSIYLGLGWYISNDTKTTKLAKIQPTREHPPELVWRDIKQSIKSLFFISLFVGAAIWIGLNGYSIVEYSESSVWSFIFWLIISMLLFDAWFYWSHRLIHHPKLYRLVHLWHHRARTPVIWSNNSDTLLDVLLVQSYWVLAALFLPLPTAYLILVHKIYDQVTGMLGHAGYEYGGKLVLRPSPFASVTYHDQHHEFYKYNYATQFIHWDRMMGTLHPDYYKATEENVRKGQEDSAKK